MTSFSRADRVSTQIQQVMSEIMQKKIKDPRLEMVTITGVKMSSDIREAIIFYTIFQSQEKQKENVARGFSSCKGFIKKILAKELSLRFMPEIKFIYDESFDYGTKMDKILKDLTPED